MLWMNEAPSTIEDQLKLLEMIKYFTIIEVSVSSFMLDSMLDA